MSLLYLLPKIYEEGKLEYEQLKAGKISSDSFLMEEIVGKPGGDAQMLAQGDNLNFMRYLIDVKDMRGKLQLIYVDPPFYSKANYEASVSIVSEKIEGLSAIKLPAYGDLWQEGLEVYLKMLCVRLFFMKDLLSEDGCLWVHLDWHAVHYVKVLIDEIFGEKNFINEVVWTYKSGGTGKRSFSRKHDTLLFYSKSKKYCFSPQKEKSYNRGLKPYRFKGVEEYKDQLGWYTMVNMKDVWQIDMVGRTSSERTGYATQKPELLLTRIIESCSKEGQICADFFGGSATMAAVAHKMGRSWISCDQGKLALAEGLKRMTREGSSFSVLRETKLMEKESEASLEVEVKRLAGQSSQLIVEVSGYGLKKAGIPLEGEGKQTIQKALKFDPLCLLVYWSVDFHYNGRLHRPQSIQVRKGNLLDTCCKCADFGQVISIKAVDVLGNITFQVINSGEKLNETSVE